MDAKRIAAIIASSHDDPFGAAGAAGITIDPAQIGSQFCALWPKARPGLSLLAGIAIFIPGAGAAAGGALQGLIKVGDAVSAEVCKT